jgi:hypothetical protein
LCTPPAVAHSRAAHRIFQPETRAADFIARNVKNRSSPHLKTVCVRHAQANGRSAEKKSLTFASHIRKKKSADRRSAGRYSPYEPDAGQTHRGLLPLKGVGGE